LSIAHHLHSPALAKRVPLSTRTSAYLNVRLLLLRLLLRVRLILPQALPRYAQE
jgi:hypothetical protein